MFKFLKEFKKLQESTGPLLLEVFGSSIDAQWIHEACNESHHPTMRERKLPLHVIVWLVIGMALWRDLAIEDVVSRLGLVLDTEGQPERLAVSATVKARKRLGYEPMEHLFATTSRYWFHERYSQIKRWHDLTVFALDGTTLSVPDTQENREHFGAPSNQHGTSGYPQVRLMVMLETSSHLIVNANFGGYKGKGTGERTLAQGMASQLPDNSLLLFDAGLFTSADLVAHTQAGPERHWLGAIKKNMTYTVTVKKQIAPNDELAVFKIPSKTRKKHPELPKSIEVRVLTGVDKKGKLKRLMTSLVDTKKYSAKDLWVLYQERWEVELGYRESKTYLLNRNEPLRSRKSDGVKQELWGVLLAYNLVRYRMAIAAHKKGLEGRQLSFKKALFNVRTFCVALSWLPSHHTTPKELLKLLKRLDSLIADDVLPPKRKGRTYPREVKVHKKTYPLKK